MVALCSFFVIVINTMVFFQTVWTRLRFINLLLLGIIATGELLEIAKRFHRRTRHANTERILFFIFKVDFTAYFRWIAPRMLYITAAMPFLLG